MQCFGYIIQIFITCAVIVVSVLTRYKKMRSIAWYVVNHNRFLILGISRLFSLGRTASWHQKKTDREIRGRSTCHIFPPRRARPSSSERSISHRIPSFYRPYRFRLFFLTRWFKGSYISLPWVGRAIVNQQRSYSNENCFPMKGSPANKIRYL